MKYFLFKNDNVHKDLLHIHIYIYIEFSILPAIRKQVIAPLELVAFNKGLVHS